MQNSLDLRVGTSMVNAPNHQLFIVGSPCCQHLCEAQVLGQMRNRLPGSFSQQHNDYSCS